MLIYNMMLVRQPKKGVGYIAHSGHAINAHMEVVMSDKNPMYEGRGPTGGFHDAAAAESRGEWNP